MKELEAYLESVEIPEQRARMEEVFQWIHEKYPKLTAAIKASGYARTKGLAKIKWTDEVDYDLLAKMIEYNIEDKKDCTTFFRK